MMNKGGGVAALPNKALLRPDEVRQYLNVSRRTVYNMIADGRLEAVVIAGHTLRVKRESVESAVVSTLD